MVHCLGSNLHTSVTPSDLSMKRLSSYLEWQRSGQSHDHRGSTDSGSHLHISCSVQHGVTEFHRLVACKQQIYFSGFWRLGCELTG